MKQFNTLKKLMTVACLGAASVANAQTIHPKAFGIVGTYASTNWYVDYVGTRFAVTSPASAAGDKLYTKAEVASGWTAMSYASLPLINIPVIMGQVNDTDGCSAFTVPMTGKIAFIWRGTCEFGFKAQQAQNAGAVAVVIANNQPGGFPIGMGAGAAGAGVTIPTFMISYADGMAITQAYAGGAGAVTMSITQWGENLDNDLGFIPGGISTWQNFATPSNQMTGTLPDAMQGIDGAFVGNYGSRQATNVHLSSLVTFSTGGAPTTVHTATVTLTTPFDNTNPAADSIWAMYSPSYSLNGAVTGNGAMRVKYTITSDSTDDNPSNDTLGSTVYFTDSLYSKGRFDFVNNRPLANLYTAPGTLASGDGLYLWGNMYYVNKGGSAADRAMWTMSSNTDTNGSITSLTSGVNVYLFKWVEGMNSQPIDSFIENGELELVGLGVKNFTGAPEDTSGGTFTVSFLDSSGSGGQPFLSANSWYYVTPELPGPPNTWFMGCDGYNNTFPRSYGRWQNNFVEYASPMWPSGRYDGTNSQVNTFNSVSAISPFGGNFDVDSVNFDSQKGLIPAVPLYVNNHPNKVTTATAAFAKFDLYPNPATEVANVVIGLDNTAKNVTYTVLNSTGRVMSKVSHNNVKNETYTYNTSGLATGNYFMIVVADGKQMFKKFTVLR